MFILLFHQRNFFAPNNVIMKKNPRYNMYTSVCICVPRSTHSMSIFFSKANLSYCRRPIDYCWLAHHFKTIWLNCGRSWISYCQIYLTISKGKRRHASCPSFIGHKYVYVHARVHHSTQIPRDMIISPRIILINLTLKWSMLLVLKLYEIRRPLLLCFFTVNEIVKVLRVSKLASSKILDGVLTALKES